MSEVDVAPERQEINGARNLVLLAAIAVLVTLVTTVIGVYIYVSSGDIYLDRSLPGLMPEESEKNGVEEHYIFEDYGAVNGGVLDEFLGHFGTVEKEVEVFAEPFADEPLSDENLIFMPGQEGGE